MLATLAIETVTERERNADVITKVKLVFWFSVGQSSIGSRRSAKVKGPQHVGNDTNFVDFVAIKKHLDGRSQVIRGRRNHCGVFPPRHKEEEETEGRGEAEGGGATSVV